MELKILRPGEAARANLDKVQEAIDTVRADIRETEKANVPLDEARERLLAVIDKGSDRAARAFASLLSHDYHYVNPPAQLGLAELAYVFGRDEFVDQVMLRVESTCPVLGLPAAERQTRLAELRAEQRELELTEEYAVLELEKQGHVVLRRADADLEILLEVWAGEAQPSTSAPTAGS